MKTNLTTADLVSRPCEPCIAVHADGGWYASTVAVVLATMNLAAQGRIESSNPVAAVWRLSELPPTSPGRIVLEACAFYRTKAGARDLAPRQIRKARRAARKMNALEAGSAHIREIARGQRAREAFYRRAALMRREERRETLPPVSAIDPVAELQASQFQVVVSQRRRYRGQSDVMVVRVELGRVPLLGDECETVES